MPNITPRLSAAAYRQLLTAKSPAAAGKPRRGPGGKPLVTKYRAQRTLIDGQWFDSRKEARHWQALTLARLATDPRDRVIELERSTRYLLIPKQDGERACYYVADFVVTYGDGRVEVVDTKSAITRKNPTYVVKRKLMLERHGIRIIEV